MQKVLCSAWRRCCDWLNMSKVICEVPWYHWHFGQVILYCGALLHIGRYLAAPLASTHQKSIAGDSRHSQNIQINKVIGENEKYVFYFMGKKHADFLANPILCTYCCPVLGFVKNAKRDFTLYPLLEVTVCLQLSCQCPLAKNWNSKGRVDPMWLLIVLTLCCKETLQIRAFYLKG